MRTSSGGAMHLGHHIIQGRFKCGRRVCELDLVQRHPDPDFGGNAETARELVSRLGIEDARAREAETLIMDFILSRVPQFTRRWMDRVDRFLDPYSTDQWWTEDMRSAFALYCQHKDEPEEMPE